MQFENVRYCLAGATVPAAFGGPIVTGAAAAGAVPVAAVDAGPVCGVIVTPLAFCSAI
jgi:hypothetical protein